MVEDQKLKQLIDAVVQAGNVINQLFGQQLHRTYKSTNADFTTEADLKAEKIITEAIEDLFPEVNIVAEEEGETNKGSEYSFIIDPLDGTNNFVLGIPAFSSSVALMHGDEVIFGVVHVPVLGDTYWAEKGKGAYLNDAALAVNPDKDIKFSTVSYYCNYQAPRDRVLRFKTAIMKLGIQRFLDLWSPAFSYCGLASGRIEGIVNDGIELYDYAAGQLIAREAGAKITGFSGEEVVSDYEARTVITNGSGLHDYLIENITNNFAR